MNDQPVKFYTECSAGGSRSNTMHFYNNRPAILGYAFLILSLLIIKANGQSSYDTSSTSHTTPAGIAPGSAAGSYGLSDFESVNPYSGKINFNLPLLSIGGRGRAGYTMSLQVQQNWEIEHHVEDPNLPCPSGGPQCFHYQVTHTYTPVDHLWSNFDNQGYSPGVMTGRQYGDPRGGGACSSNFSFYRTLTHLTFIKPDGSEIEFRDTLNGGKPMPPANCSPVSRGTEFVSVDGSFATFVSNTQINDVVYVKNQSSGGMQPSGTLKWSDGTVYQIVSGKVTKITDKDGNFLLFDYTQNPIQVTDSVGRVFNGRTYTRNNPGGGVATRGVGMTYDTLSNRLRSGYSLRGRYDLFPVDYSNPSFNTDYNPTVISAVVLPDGRKYELFYNSYGELAEVILPTGGAIEYDWQANSGLIGSGSEQDGGDYLVYRRVEKRRVYKENHQLQTETAYQKITTPAGEPSSPVTVVEESTYDNSATPRMLGKIRHFYYGNATPPPSYNTNNPVTDQPYTDGREYKTEVYAGDGTTLLRKVENTFQPGVSLAANPTAQINGRVTETTTTLADTNQVSKQTFAYDSFNNRTDVYEYDYGAGAPLRHTHTDYVADPNYTGYAGAYLRNLPSASQIYGYQNGTEVLAAQTQILYDETALTPRSNVTGWTDPNRLQRGNATTVRTWKHSAGETDTWLETKAEYDVLGNVVKTTDANGKSIAIDYTDKFGSPDSEVRSNTAPAQLNGQSTFAFPTSSTNLALNWVMGYAQFDYFTGQPVNTEDINGVISKTVYTDPLDRPTQSVTAIGTTFERQTNINYHDELTERRVETKSDLNVLNDNLLKSESFYDGLGRTIESRRYEAGGGYIATKSVPFAVIQDPETSIWRVGAQGTNPYRPLAGEQPVWTTSLSDALGRNIKTITPDGAIVKTEYSGNAVTVTDQALKQRRSITNALGQLTRVDEPTGAGLGAVNTPNQPTIYGYDTLGNLTSVSQNGTNTIQCGANNTSCSQSRIFTYDSLSRLKSAVNPESGTIKYSYDLNGNLQTKRDARGIKTVYDYDALNRLYARCYRNIGTTAPLGMTTCQGNTETPEINTPDVAYTYDNLTNAKGKLIKVESSVSKTEYQAFDVLGRVTQSQQTTSGAAYGAPMTYKYNISGALIEETYPSTRVVKNVLDSSGDLSIVQSSKNGVSGYFNYAKSFTYTAAGAVSSMQLGNGKWESTVFNNRLQPTQIALGTTNSGTDKLLLNFDYGGSTNNGNVQWQKITVPTVGSTPGFVATQNYTYDALNRLQSAEETTPGQAGWKQTFTYDRYGNRQFDMGNTTIPDGSCQTAVCNPTVDPNTNKLVGYTFDNAGNTKVDAQGRIFTYDAENKQTEVKNSSTVSLGQYTYDGDGKRVKKFLPSSGETTIFVYDASGKMVAEYSTTVEPAATARVSYLTQDHLGSPRITTDANGKVFSRRDFMPFGEEIDSPMTAQRNVNLNYGDDGLRQKFTSYERDPETNNELDFAQARMYANKLGRFNNPDPQFGEIRRPQTWNGYIYVNNNPTNLIDPMGARDIPGYISTFVFSNIRNVIFTALKFNLSAGGIFALAGWETGWGRSNAYRNNNPGGLSGGSTKANFTFDSLEKGYEFMGKSFQDHFSDAIGIYDPHKFLDSIVDNNGEKYNENKGYIDKVKGVLTSFGLDFFDDYILTPLRQGTSVKANGVTFENSSELFRILNSGNQYDIQLANQFITGLHTQWLNYVRNLGSNNDRHVQEIRRNFSLPGSSVLEEEEGLYEYRLSAAKNLNR